jgi:DNA polymerase V
VASWRLPYPTSFTPALVAAAQALLAHAYKPGFVYHKAGIFLSDIVAHTERQQNVFTGIDDERRTRLMETVDQINSKHGRHTVRPLAVGGQRGWEMRRGNLSPRYTTQLGEILRVRAC